MQRMLRGLPANKTVRAIVRKTAMDYFGCNRFS
jgi:hypothetical protein